MPDQKLNSDYSGRILNGDYSHQLINNLTAYIQIFRAFDDVGSPAVPYIAAWEETQNIIWYEFVSRRFLELLRCNQANAPETLRNSIVERHVYISKNFNRGVKQEIIKRRAMPTHRPGLRVEAKQKGAVEAVYKIMLEGAKPFWLKDQATIEAFGTDNIYLSMGILTIVTKEMEAEEDLKRARNELRIREKKFRDLAIHDNLTGLYNTRHLYTALSKLIVQSAASGRSFSLIFMDIDNFKHVVDTHGHLNASRTLQEIAATIEAALQRPAYGVAYGGDEFVIVLPGLDKQQALDVAKTIRSRIKEGAYLQKEGLNVRISASLGVSTFPQDADTLTDLLSLADKAMFSVKERGKDSVCAISYKTAATGNSAREIIFYDCKD